jgi:hypothetical protein
LELKLGLPWRPVASTRSRAVQFRAARRRLTSDRAGRAQVPCE